MDEETLKEALALKLVEENRKNSFLDFIDKSNTNISGDTNGADGRVQFNLPNGITAGVGGKYDRGRPGQVINSAFASMPMGQGRFALNADRGVGNVPQDQIMAQYSRRF